MGMLGCGAECLYSAAPFAGSLKMQSHLTCDGGFALGKDRAQALCDADVTTGAAGGSLAAIEHLAIELMREDVKGGTGAIGQLILPRALHKIEAPGQGI